MGQETDSEEGTPLTRSPRSTAEKRRFKVIVVGKSGTGKSSLCNQILGDQKFAVAFGLCSTTKAIQSETTEKYGVNLTIVDTPELDDVGRQKILDEIDFSDSSCQHVILFCVRCDARFSRDELETYEMLRQKLGPGLCSRLLLAFTHGDERGTESDGSSPEDEPRDHTPGETLHEKQRSNKTTEEAISDFTKTQTKNFRRNGDLKRARDSKYDEEGQLQKSGNTDFKVNYRKEDGVELRMSGESESSKDLELSNRPENIFQREADHGDNLESVNQNLVTLAQSLTESLEQPSEKDQEPEKGLPPQGLQDLPQPKPDDQAGKLHDDSEDVGEEMGVDPDGDAKECVGASDEYAEKAGGESDEEAKECLAVADGDSKTDSDEDAKIDGTDLGGDGEEAEADSDEDEAVVAAERELGEELQETWPNLRILLDNAQNRFLLFNNKPGNDDSGAVRRLVKKLKELDLDSDEPEQKVPDSKPDPLSFWERHGKWFILGAVFLTAFPCAAYLVSWVWMGGLKARLVNVIAAVFPMPPVNVTPPVDDGHTSSSPL